MENNKPLSARLFQLLTVTLGPDGVLKWLPIQPFLPGDNKRQLLGHLFFRQEEMVDGIVVALMQRPELFPDIDDRHEELSEEQEAAGGWYLLGIGFETLGRVCKETSNRTQARLNIRCKDILKQVIAGYNNPTLAPHLDHKRRLSILLPALSVWEDINQSKGKKPARPAPATEPPTPAKKQRERQAKDERRTRTYRILEDLVEGLRERSKR